ncbi:MAG: radical SAM protein [Candidatus Aminicenantes bacterium]|nr:radical SAM protein [Candidatus Aminicenantes bacterium]
MSKCKNCGKENRLIADFLCLCQDCILHDFKNCEPRIHQAHQMSREAFGLPPHPPRDEGGKLCRFCFNQCLLGPGSKGYCGIRENVEGKIKPLPKEGFFSWYYDPLPTNCVADWVCAGGTGAGYPRFAYSEGAEYGHKNLAVFYYGCTFNCLFCQNSSHKERLQRGRPHPTSDLAQAVDDRTSCVCYFGGDPSPHLPHSIHSSRLALAQKEKEILRFCWETNGTMNSRFLEEILDIALESGGCVKFDLKTFHSSLNTALCGRSNEQTKANFELAATWTKKRKEPPLVVASTLLVPGYVDRQEVYQIAKFIASLDSNLPYALLGFHPHFYCRDLPVTSRRQAQECQEAALEAGLKRVRIGNLHLLGNDY